MQNNSIYKRLSRLEAAENQRRSELMETLKAAYEQACADENEQDAALFARKIRDKLLAQSDCRVALDRFNIDVPSGSTFSAWLGFLKSLGGVLSGDWAVYRQALRDLPQQEGFPLNVVFPNPPDGVESAE